MRALEKRFAGLFFFLVFVIIFSFSFSRKWFFLIIQILFSKCFFFNWHFLLIFHVGIAEHLKGPIPNEWQPSQYVYPPVPTYIWTKNHYSFGREYRVSADGEYSDWYDWEDKVFDGDGTLEDGSTGTLLPLTLGAKPEPWVNSYDYPTGKEQDDVKKLHEVCSKISFYNLNTLYKSYPSNQIFNFFGVNFTEINDCKYCNFWRLK